MQIDSVTASEAAVLDAIQRRGIATLPEVAVLSRLTPSEVRAAVKRLDDQHLLKRIEPSFLKLTQVGEEIALSNLSRKVSPFRRADELDKAEVESRLDDIIEQL